MSRFKIVEVNSPALERDFIQVNVICNNHLENFIRPLDKDIREVFDPKKNKTFRFGKAIRWILKNEKSELIGRIAAFTNKRYKNKGDDVAVGGVGFFDCINDQEAANLLLDTAKNWLAQEGMQAMDGPINFGERDRWWGLVVEGFQEPLYCMNFNPPFYKNLFENYGFRVFFHQICFGLDAKKRLKDKLFDRHAALSKVPGYKAVHIKKNQLEKFAADFTIIYNKAWSGHGGLKELRKEQVLLMFRKMKPILDEKVVWFTYYDEHPIAMFVNVPDLNQWFKYLNGKFDLFHKLKFLWLKRTKPCKKLTGVVFGIVPEFQGKGVDAFMVVEAAKIVQPQTAYTEYEMQWIGDFNPKMLNIADSLGETYRSRKLTTYRYLFDRTKEYKRHPILN